MTWPFSHPLFCIGAVLAFIACFGFLIFIRGFLFGLNHVFYIDGHDEYTNLARVRTGWGMALMVNMFVLWVLIRGLATLFGYDNADPSKTSTVLICYVILVVFLYFMGLAFKKEGH